MDNPIVIIIITQALVRIEYLHGYMRAIATRGGYTQSKLWGIVHVVYRLWLNVSEDI